MNIVARQNKLAKIMSKIELAQDWNRIAFLASFGAVLHACTCIGSPKKMNVVDYAAVPAIILTAKRSFSLAKKEQQGQNIWHSLQQKAVTRS